jgi:hypothetical protein
MTHRLFGRADWVLVLTLVVSYAYFYQAGGWNQNSRFDLVRAIVEEHSTRIDTYVDNTGDRALVGGHAYSDKAPGQALTAVPFAAAWGVVFPSPQSPTNLALLAYAATVWAAGLPTVIAALSLAWSARALGSSPSGSVIAALAFGIGSPAWVYATLMWGHALAAGCLTLAFAAALALRTSRHALLPLVVGAAAGWAIVAEYPAAPAAAIVVALALYYGRRGLLRVSIFAAVGFILTLAALAIYNAASFGSPLFVSYSGVQGFAGMSEGLFGVTFPKRTILQEILFGQFRGLIPLAPAVVLAPIGLFLAGRRADNHPAVAAAVAIPAYYLLFNAAYYYWDGGFSYGPRHIGAALPFLFLGLGPLWTRAGRAVRVLIALTVSFGVVVTSMAISTIVLLPEDVSAPLTQLIIPAFLRADLAQNRQSFLQYGTANPAQGLLGAWNLGQLLGLQGLASVLPLACLWALAAWLLNSAIRRQPPAHRAPTSPGPNKK